MIPFHKKRTFDFMYMEFFNCMDVMWMVLFYQQITTEKPITKITRFDVNCSNHKRNKVECIIAKRECSIQFGTNESVQIFAVCVCVDINILFLFFCFKFPPKLDFTIFLANAIGKKSAIYLFISNIARTIWKIFGQCVTSSECDYDRRRHPLWNST